MNNPTPNSTRTRPQRFGFDVRLLAVLFCFSMAAWSAFGAKPSPQPAMASGSAQQLAVHDIAKPQPHAPQEVRSIPIGEYDVAFQVVAGNPTGEHDTEFGDTVDPPLWRVLTLIAKKKDGSLADVRLLRPLWWLEEQHATVGGHVEIHVPECGIEGQAEVLAIEPCPPIKPRAGLRVVTGVFKHHASQVLDVYVEGLDEPIGTTPNHPFWSEDRQTFVRADELKEGEHLKAFNGTPIVRRVVPLADPEPVFNLEVQCDHVYHVAKNGLLVHNSADDCIRWIDPRRLNFSQTTVNRNVVDYVVSMETGAWNWRRAGTELNVIVRPNGMMVAIDNRRLLAARLTGQSKIPIRIRRVGDTLPDTGARRTFGDKLNERLRRNGLGGDGSSEFPAIDF